MKNLFKKLLPILFLLFVSTNVFAKSYLWDYIRPEIQFIESIELPVKILVFALAAAVFVISLLAYFKSRSKRILLVSIAFLFFTLKWGVKIIDLFYSPGKFLSDASENIFELGILALLLVALFYRKSWNKLFEKQK